MHTEESSVYTQGQFIYIYIYIIHIHYSTSKHGISSTKVKSKAKLKILMLIKLDKYSFLHCKSNIKQKTKLEKAVSEQSLLWCEC